MGFEAVDRSGTYSVKWESRREKFGMDDLLPLWVADMDLASPPCVAEAIVKRANHPLYGYTIYPESFYEAIIGWQQERFGWNIVKEDIIPSHGVVSSLALCLEAYSVPGEGVIVQTPIYPPFLSLTHKHRRKLLENRLLYSEGGYSIDFDDLEAKAKEAKLFLFCSPHNPTTRVWDREELEMVAAICREHDLIVVSDEIHSDVVYKKRHITLASLLPERTVHLSAPSKTFNIAGLGTSYAIIPERKLRRLYQSEQRKCALSDGNPFGIEALIAAYTQGSEWLESLKEHLWSNREFVRDFLRENSIPIVPVPTEATYLMWLDCRGMGMDDRELESFFVFEAKLGLNTGVSFGEAGSGFMRLNIGTSQEVLEIAMVRLRNSYFLRKKTHGD